MKYVLNLILIGVVGYLSYELYKTVEEVVVFNKEKAIRDSATIDKLKLLRRVQLAHKSDYQLYADSFDKLKEFANNGNYKILTKIGDPNDSTVVARVDTSLVSIVDSLFEGNKQAISELDMIPHSGGAKFEIQADTINKNDITIPAFEIRAPYEAMYNGLIEKYYAPKIGQKMRVGSLEDGSTSGNWGE